jgi:RNA polymerase-binding protein DksA
VTTLPLDELRTALVAERERVARAIEYLHEENQGSLEDDTGKIAPGVDNHPADAATETVDRELDYTLEENAEHVLGAIDSALKRMEDGTYGLCQNCGQPISPERLEAMPWATRCIDCKRKEERG